MNPNSHIRDGLRIYFNLVKHGVIPSNEEEGKLYFSDINIREFVRTCAMESGTEILEGTDNIHLVSSENNSIFSTPYHVLKDKMKFQNKDEFHLLCIVALVYFAEVDGSLIVRSIAEREGVSYTKLARNVDMVLEGWLEKIKLEPDFELQWGINIQVIAELYLTKNLKDDKINSLRASFRTKWSIIHTWISFLKEQKLVRYFESSDNYVIFPTDILYERLELGYRDDDRYRNIKTLIHETKNNTIYQNSNQDIEVEN